MSSSNFPRFDRNLNTGKDQNVDSSMAKATNTVLHDREHPSALVLPVVPGDRLSQTQELLWIEARAGEGR